MKRQQAAQLWIDLKHDINETKRFRAFSVVRKSSSSAVRSIMETGDNGLLIIINLISLLDPKNLWIWINMVSHFFVLIVINVL